MNDQSKRQKNKGGRKPKTDPCVHRYVFRLNDNDNNKFLSLFEASGMDNKAQFITSLLFSREIKTVKIDKGTVDFYMRLTSFYAQFRAIGVNYNQVVKLLYTHFTEKKAAAFLYRLEKNTAELAVLCQKIIELANEFNSRSLNK
ncbi:conjugal transfer protein MobA [Chryseobacterium gleum]|uniref:conjugal transfer protein MobA n=1 Tax=Chryseobacterium gleum TaxID=250 RepID=UPI00241DD569|nr:conjugal transfer protein MobA [Chryseobacterium gleum]